MRHDFSSSITEKAILVFSLSAAAIAVSGCNGPLGFGGGGGNGGGGGSSDPCAILNFHGSANAGFNAAGVFTVSPVSPDAISSITPLGNLNPPGHTYATDHMYLLLQNMAGDSNTVRAAAAGTIISAYQPGGSDWKVEIEVDQSFFYYYDHIHFSAHVGDHVSPGDVIGSNSGNAAAVDFGVYNFNNAPLAGILDSCLAQSEAYVDSPLKYYSGGLQTTLYKLSGNKDGKVDYDQAGRLVGDWVLDGDRAMDSNDVQLTFVYHVGSSSMRVSVGGNLAGGAATYAVQDGAPDFSTITTESGQVDYKLYPTTNGDDSAPGSQYGVLSVQMLSDSRIRVEIFPGANAHGSFDGSALTYSR